MKYNGLTDEQMMKVLELIPEDKKKEFENFEVVTFVKDENGETKVEEIAEEPKETKGFKAKITGHFKKKKEQWEKMTVGQKFLAVGKNLGVGAGVFAAGVTVGDLINGHNDDVYDEMTDIPEPTPEEPETVPEPVEESIGE